MDFFARQDYQRVILYIVTSVFVLAILKYILPFFWPIVLALLIVLPLQRSYQKREQVRKKHVKNGKGFMAGGILFGIILLVAILIVGAGTFLISKARHFAQDAGFIMESLQTVVSNICMNIEDFFGLEEGILMMWMQHTAQGIGGSFADSGKGLITGSIKYMAIVGKVSTFVLVSFICVVLFAREIEDWQQGLLKLAVLEPAIDRILSIIIRIGKKIGAMIKAYLKTQGIILICISVTATAGLYFAGMKEAYFYGLLAGFMDFLPFIGTGIVLIPIGVVSFIQGNIVGGIIVVVTYLTCVFIRELLEPRLLGNGMKFSPVAILISVYAGVMFYGLSGVVMGPITLLILVELGREIFMK